MDGIGGSGNAAIRLPLQQVSGSVRGRLLHVGRHGALVYTPSFTAGELQQRVGLFGHDLGQLSWATEGTSSVLPDAQGVWLGPFKGLVRLVDWGSGVERARIALTDKRLAALVCRSASVILLDYFEDGGYCAIDTSGRLLWRRPRSVGPVVAEGSRFLFAQPFGRQLVCVDAESGEELWSRDVLPPGAGERSREYELVEGFPSVTVCGERVVLVQVFSDVTLVDFGSGRVLDRAVTRFAGLYCTTDRFVYFHQPYALMTFDHQKMKEVDRISFETDVRPLYGGLRATARGMTVGDDVVFWTVPDGVLMGVSRRAGPDGVHDTWRAEVGGLSPISDHPVTWGRYLYWNRAVLPPELPSVVCFQSSTSGRQ